MDDKQLFQLLEKHLLEDKKPSIKLRNIISENIEESSVFFILSKLINVEQEVKHHPEGDVLEHTLQVVDEAAKYRDKVSNPRVFMWAALLHDIGKEKTTMKRNGRWTAYNHDRVGAEMCHRLLRELSNDKEFNKSVCNLIRHHMTYLYVTKRLPYGDIKTMVEEANVSDVAYITLCDRLGRGEMSVENKEKIVDSLNDFLKIVSGRTREKYGLIELK